MPGTQSSNVLPVNYRLDEYVIQSVLGHGGFGITYLARDTRLGALVAIKEYFPQAFAQRGPASAIHPNSGDNADAENYRWGLQEFLKEAQALAQFKHANIVRVLRFLEANGTAYMVMEYEEGESLSAHVARHGGFLAEPTLLNIFLPILNGLQAVHDAGLLHLDIKPDNIYLRRSGPPMLIDFGAARQRQSGTRSEKVALTPGYAALEQYPGQGGLGPWSDVYSMGATLYRCITGREPLGARERVTGRKKLHVDPLIPATRFDRPLYSAHIRECVDAAIALSADERPRSAFALQNGLMGKGLIEPRKAVADNAYSRGPGFIGILSDVVQGKKRRLIPRGPLEKLLVVLVFLAVMVVAPVHIMISLGRMSEGDMLDYLDLGRVTVIETAKGTTRYIEENVLHIKRPPEYTPPPPSRTIARPVPVKPEEERPAPAFDPAKRLAGTFSLPAAATSMAFLQGGRTLALGYENGAIELRSAESGAPLRTLAPATRVPGVVAAAPDGRVLALSAAAGAIQIWDIEKNILLVELPGHDDPVIALAFSPDGKQLASAGRDQTAKLWDVYSSQMLLDLSKPSSEPLAFAFSPDGATLAVADSGGGIRYWNLATRRDIAYVGTRDQPVYALAYSPNGKWFALGGEQGFLGLWDVSRKHDDRVLPDAPDTVHALAFSQDSKWLVVSGSDASLQLWDVETGSMVQRYAGANHQSYALTLAPEDRQIAAAGIDGKLTIWR